VCHSPQYCFYSLRASTLAKLKAFQIETLPNRLRTSKSGIDIMCVCWTAGSRAFQQPSVIQWQLGPNHWSQLDTQPRLIRALGFVRKELPPSRLGMGKDQNPRGTRSATLWLQNTNTFRKRVRNLPSGTVKQLSVVRPRKSRFLALWQLDPAPDATSSSPSREGNPPSQPSPSIPCNSSVWSRLLTTIK
jgi:hypothetical protein